MKIQSLTVQHDPAEDRIVLLTRSADAEQILLLTRRLTCGLLAALSKQIEHTQGDQRLAQSGLQDELISMKHSRALSRVREAQADRPAVSAAPQRLPTRLLTKIGIRDQAQGRQLLFSDARGEVASIALDAAQLHWFVGRLATHSRKAGWGNPVPVPAWLEQNPSPEPASGQQAGRSLH
jgi:hypothetical protein